MTLVVAVIDNGKIYIESDSRVNDPLAIKSSPLCGVLKTVIIHPFVSVSFAGIIDYAQEAISEIISRPISDLNSLLGFLIQSNIESDNSTDYIVASLLGGNPRLFKISNGGIQDSISQCWIGDKNGFSEYQKHFHSLREDLPRIEKVNSSFAHVINNSEFETIGDFHISTVTNNEISPNGPVFLYKMNVKVFIDEEQTISFEEKGQWKPLPLGTVQGGSHGLSYLVTESPSHHGIAVHYTHGNFGLFFCPQISFDAVFIKNVNGIQFVNEIQKKYGVKVRGFIKSSATAIKLV